MKERQQKKIVMVLSQDTFFLNHFWRHADMARECFFDVTVVANQTNPKVVEKIKSLGNNFISLDISRASTNVFSLIGSLLKLYRIYNELKPDVIFQFGTKLILLGSLARLFLRKKHFVINYLTGLGILFVYKTAKAALLRGFIRAGFFWLLNPNHSKVVVENDGDLQYFIRNRSVRACDAYLIQGAGVDVNKFKPIPWGNKQKTLTVVTCSRLLKSKGIVEFLDVAKKFSQENYPIQMWVVGEIDSQNPDSLTRCELQNWKAANVCKFFGHIDDVSNILKEAHIFVLPSYREGLSKALLEAAAVGLPIITTNAVGCKEVVVNSNGIIVPCGDIDALYCAIKKLALHPEKLPLMGEKSRELAIRKFSETVVLNQIKQLYLDANKDLAQR